MTSNPTNRIRQETGPERIYLQPACCADPDVGRLWSEFDETPGECEEGQEWTEYVRVDRERGDG